MDFARHTRPEERRREAARLKDAPTARVVVRNVLRDVRFTGSSEPRTPGKALLLCGGAGHDGRPKPSRRSAPRRRSGMVWRACSSGSSRRWRGSRASFPASIRAASPAGSRSSRGAATDASGAPGGGGRMAMLRGRLFEKMGAITRQCSGRFRPSLPGKSRARPTTRVSGRPASRSSPIPGARTFPTVHMNVRLVRTTKTWFGGGADLTPMLDERRVPRPTPTPCCSTRRCAAPARDTPQRSPTPIGSKRGATSISSSSTATSRAGSAAFSSTI